MRQGIQFKSPIGLITVITRGEGISSVHIGNGFPLSKQEQTPNELLIRCQKQFGEFFSAKRKRFDLPLDWQILSGFQADVLPLVHEIPYGEVRAYVDIARELHKPSAARAVGMALAHNPLPILIPCHRVVAASGHLSGFSAADGINTKAWLLQLEGHRVVAQKLA